MSAQLLMIFGICVSDADEIIVESHQEGQFYNNVKILEGAINKEKEKMSVSEWENCKLGLERFNSWKNHYKEDVKDCIPQKVLKELLPALRYAEKHHLDK
jgi:hypothetical protein